MLCLQDVLRLDNSARMNSPGKAEGNWAWRLPSGFSFAKLGREAAQLRSLATMFDRCATMRVREDAEAALKAAAAVSAAADNGAAGSSSGVVNPSSNDPSDADPLEAFCGDVPDADECRVFEL